MIFDTYFIAFLAAGHPLPAQNRHIEGASLLAIPC